MNEYYSPEICKKCGGKCCQIMPAPYTPEDIQRIFGSVDNAVKSGIVAIDWWEADTPLYFMRPKTIKTDDLYDPSWGGCCIHWTPTGCRLTRENMPTFCKTLEGKKNSNCDDHIKEKNSKYIAGKLWKEAGFDLEYIEED